MALNPSPSVCGKLNGNLLSFDLCESLSEEETQRGFDVDFYLKILPALLAASAMKNDVYASLSLFFLLFL
jgi:hypothetical protein